MNSKQVALKALEKALESRHAPRLALKGILSDNIEEIEAAVALGWNPALKIDGGRDALSRALDAPSEKTALWLLERFPLASMSSEAFAVGAGRSTWSAAAMEAVEQFGAGVGGTIRWAKACAKSDDAEAYFIKSIKESSIWRVSPDFSLEGKIEHAGAIFSAMETNPKLMKNRELLEAAANFYACESAKALAGGAPADVEAWQEKLEILLGNFVDNHWPLAPAKQLWDKIPMAAVAMGLAPIDADRHIIKTSRLWTNAAARRMEGGASEMGYYILMAGTVDNVKFALAQGWIRPVMVTAEARFEHPGFIAWQQRESERKAGKPLPMASRWERCRQTIETCDLPEKQRQDMLDLCDKPNPVAWAGTQTHVSTRIVKMASPMEILLAGSPLSKSSMRGNADKERLGLVAEVLSEAGHGVSEAFCGALGKAALQNGGALGHVKRLAEREALEAAAAPAPSKAKRRSL